MQLKRFRRRFRKSVKAQQRQVEELSAATEKSLERNVFKRVSRLKPVRRFVVSWTALMVLLIGLLVAQFQHLSTYYQQVEAVPGGIYTEGIVGSISNVNPIYATSDVDRTLSRLLFAGLLKYSAQGKLEPNLAASYRVDENGRQYTVTLKKGLTWHDGRPLTAQDVAFTFKTIKDPDARSPLFTSWQNVAVTTPNQNTIVFRLPSALASFPYTLTTGIIPQHILGRVVAGNMRSTEFNTLSPVGAGPFKWRALEVTGSDPAEIEEQVALVPFEQYVGGKPKLNEFIVRAYPSKERLSAAFESGQLTAAAGLDEMPAEAPEAAQKNDLLLTAGTYAFFKVNHGVLASPKVRQALVAAARPSEIINKLDYITRPVDSPLLKGQVAYNKAYAQKTNDLALAQRLLAEDGWLAGDDGLVRKNGKPLTFKLLATDTPEYRLVTDQLRRQWQAIGVKLEPHLASPADYANALSGHDYEAVLHGISLGYDPDVYAYWDGSQADVRSATRLNLSEWNNATANTALEAGRTRLDAAIRGVKYAPFLKAWQDDAPALGLYQPRFLYLTRGEVHGLTDKPITTSIDRFNDVQNWQIRTARVTTKQ